MIGKGTLILLLCCSLGTLPADIWQIFLLCPTSPFVSDVPLSLQIHFFVAPTFAFNQNAHWLAFFSEARGLALRDPASEPF
jgi:hypothetical protein